METNSEIEPRGKSIFVDAYLQIDDIVSSIYKEDFPPILREQAQNDASEFISARMAVDGYNSIRSKDPDERRFAHQQKEQAYNAINEAGKGNWQPMKELLQEEARISFENAQQRLNRFGKMVGKDLTLTAEQTEIRANAFINLANYLI